MKLKVTILFIGIILLFNSCEENDTENIICSYIYVHGLKISLTEKNNPINGAIKIIATEDNYEETLENSDPNMPFYGAGERKGTYILIVTSDNYKTFVSEPIVVTADECHVIPEIRTFELDLK